jgi:two-component system, response regulator YesN
LPYQILLVDDNREFREELRECLDEYDVIEAANGLEALQKLKQPNEIDLVILDVMMPGLRGTEVLKEIKKIDPDLGIIILTGYSSKDVAIEALKGRADEYLEKPLEIGHAKEIIAGLLEKRELKDLRSGSSAVSKIERVKRFIERNCHKKVCLRDAAEVIGLNPKYLSRLFKQRTGLGFNDYIMKVKIKAAKKVLKRTDIKIASVAEQFGYQNPESFIRAFKKLAGRTPSEFRGKHD